MLASFPSRWSSTYMGYRSTNRANPRVGEVKSGLRLDRPGGESILEKRALGFSEGDLFR